MSDIDEYGELTEQIKALTKRQEALKAKLKQLGNGEHIGERYNVYVTPKTWNGFDTTSMLIDHSDLMLQYATSKPYQEVTVQRKDS